MRFRILRHHSGGVMIRAIDGLGGPPAYACCYHPEHLRFAEIRRIFRNELREQLPKLREALIERLR